MIKPVDLVSAHGSSSGNQREIDGSALCGCFYCLEVFPASRVIEWIDGVGAETAVCPNCGIDSVIGDASGYPVTNKKFLEAMHERWFSAAS